MLDNPFSIDSATYARARPRYPDALFAWIASQAPSLGAAWDCATGNGQAAVGLAEHFDRVYATDVSAEQIAHAASHERLRYHVAPAEASALPPASVDVVTVAQALHWFDMPRFWQEVSRVSRPQAMFCAFSYVWPVVEEEVDRAFFLPVREAVDPFWAEGNRIIMRGYPDSFLQCPFTRIEPPEVDILLSWSAEEMIAFVSTWSAFKKATPGVLAEVRSACERVRALLGERQVEVRMPIRIIAARLP